MTNGYAAPITKQLSRSRNVEEEMKSIHPEASGQRRRETAKKSICYVGIVLIVFANALYAQEGGSVSVASSVSKSKMTIGDTVRYAITVKHDPKIKIQWPSLAANLGAFEIRDYHVADAEEKDDSIIEQVSYVISTFDTGRYEIPPLRIQYQQPPDSTWQALATQKLEIYVASILPSEAGDIRDVKAPLELPRDWRQIIFIAAVIVVVLALAGLFYVWWRQRQGKSLLPVRQEPLRPAHEIALEALEKLRASDLLQRREIKAFYIELSDIIRRYIEGRYFVIALEMTTEQLLGNLQEAQIDREHSELIRTFLEQCDLVKFAKYIPEAAENEQALRLGFEIVEKTKLILLEPAALEKTSSPPLIEEAH